MVLSRKFVMCGERFLGNIETQDSISKRI